MLSAEFVLRQNPLFAGLPAASLQKIAKLAAGRSFTKGSTIFFQGDPGDALFGIAAGQILITASAPDGREISLNLLMPGEVFGEIALLDGEARTANARAAQDSQLFVISRSDFMRLLEQEPLLSIELLKLFCQRVRTTSERVEESALLSVPEQLSRRLLTLATTSGTDDGERTLLSISQADLAAFLGVSRQVVNGYLGDWSREGWIELGRAKIWLRDRQALEDIGADSGL